MVFWRNETSGMPQKLVRTVCSRTTLANFSAPSPVMLLNATLHETGVDFKRQGVLTAGIEGWGGVLKGGEGHVLPEALGQVLGGLRVEKVVAEAANRAESGVS